MMELTRLKRWVGPGFVYPGSLKCYNPPWLSALETGEMCKAVATCYDWIYDYLTPKERSVIRKALVEKGIKPLRTWFDPHRYCKVPTLPVQIGNWRGVCGGGAGVASLALLYEEPEAGKWIRQIRDYIRWWITYKGGEYFITDWRSRKKIKPVAGPSSPTFGLDGGFLESICYLNYGASYAFYFCSALREITGENLYRYFPSNINNFFAINN